MKRNRTRTFVRLAAIVTLVALAATALVFPGLGPWLVREDPLAKSDAIVVLGGTRFERPLEAVDLFKEGWAPKVFLVRQISDWGELALTERGVPYLREADIQVDVMRRLGMPDSALEILDEVDSTAAEAETLLHIATTRRLSRVIVVTSKQHTRRAGLVMRRRLGGTGVEVIVRASRYDRSDIDHWWRSRSTLRFTLFETQRYVAYWLGIAD